MPVNRLFLAELNLKLVRGPSPPAATPSAAPAGGTPANPPSPRGRPAVADVALASGSSNAGVAPSGLIATAAEEYESIDDFRWEGDENGVEFASAVARESNNNIKQRQQRRQNKTK